MKTPHTQHHLHIPSTYSLEISNLSDTFAGTCWHESSPLNTRLHKKTVLISACFAYSDKMPLEATMCCHCCYHDTAASLITMSSQSLSQMGLEYVMRPGVHDTSLFKTTKPLQQLHCLTPQVCTSAKQPLPKQAATRICISVVPSNESL